MLLQLASYAAIVLALLLIGLGVFLRWGTRWSSTPAERSLDLSGDRLLEDGPAARVAMTRAISIQAPPEVVWPWLTQLGRGAGWYSIDRLDNGGKRSARHIVSWIPEARIGDASAIGYLRHIAPGQTLVWWADGVGFLGAQCRLITDINLKPDGESGASRLIIRMSADATGAMAPVAMLLFQFIDSIMARRQLIGIRDRVESYGARTANPEEPESSARDRYQLYEVIYTSGEQAGVPGKELARRWRGAAIADGFDSDSPHSAGSRL